MTALRVLTVDLAGHDGQGPLAALASQLRQNARVATVRTAITVADALRLLASQPFDVVVLVGVAAPPLVSVCQPPDGPVLVLAGAEEGSAADAFETDAVDFLRPPVTLARLEETLRRVERRLWVRASPWDEGDHGAVLAVEAGGCTRFVHRRDVVYAEAHGDYVRLRAAGRDPGLYVVRTTLDALEQAWAGDGFVRVHRSFLVAVRAVTELRLDPVGGHVVRALGYELPVSRRRARELRERLHVPSPRGPHHDAQLRTPSARVSGGAS